MSEPPSTIVPKTAIELRRARRRVLLRRYAIFVGIPTALAILYFALIAAPQYDARVTLALESGEGRATIEAGGKESNAGNQRDARLLRAHVTSRRALDHLDEGGAFRAHYQGSGDVLTRLDDDANSEEVFDFFRSQIVAASDATSNVLQIRVRAFEPAAARQFADALVVFATTWASSQNALSRESLIGSAQAEVVRAKTAVVDARRAALAALGTTDVTAAQRAEPVVIDMELANRGLELALTSLQEAKLASARSDRVVVVLDPPRQPEQASRPRPMWGIATVLVCAAVLVSVLSLLGAAVREHANF